LQQFLDLPFELRKRGGHDPKAGIDDDFPSGSCQRQARANRFANTPPDPVSDHRSTQGARAGETDPYAFHSIISQAKGGEQRPGKFGAIVVDSTEILGTQDAGTLGKAGDAATSPS
jgi:hypothetical protein